MGNQLIMFKIIAPIINLEISENVPEHHIYIGKEISSYLDSELLQQIGFIEAGRIISNPTYFLLYEKLDEPYDVYLSNFSGQNNAILSLGFWLIKDCAVFSPIAFLLSNEEKVSKKDIKNIFYSNSQGNFNKSKFNKDEIIKAYSHVETLFSLFESPKAPTQKRYENHIMNPATTVNYNDFENLHRALNFIVLARSTSILPQKVSYYIIALESIFGNGETGDLTFKMSYRIPHFFDVPVEEKNEIHSVIKKAYNIRSKFLHGDKLDQKSKQHILEIQVEISTKIDDIIRRIINFIIDNESILDILNDRTSFHKYFHDKLIR